MAEEKKVEYDYTRLLIPVGPVHPALKEPIHFKVVVRREEILDVDVRLGYAHRGIEALAETRNLIQALYLIERICGICSHSHTTCFTQAIEEIGGIQPSDRALYLRTLIAELERIHSHLLWLGVVAYEIGFDTLFMFTWRIREKIMDLFEEITGNRVHHSMNTFVGVRWDINSSLKEKVSVSMKEIKKAVQYLHDVFQDKSVEKRLCKVGLLSHDVAKELCIVGPTARGSGVKMDIRKDDPYASYGDLRDYFSMVVRSESDAYARTEVRIFELFEAINLILTILDRLPNGTAAPKESVLRLMRRIPEGEAVSRVEAPRGELIHFVKTDGKEGLRRLKVRTPTLANIMSIRPMLVGGEIADIPVVVASIDPCISCTDRITIVDQDREEIRIVDSKGLWRRKW
ncbi:MAG: Membrane-bound hydrogenase subunit alpha [Candidatus Bathyarchaeota archaeon BA1]|nr:MAG: Membrane-bound hydrogenase subunit alpha [Candidatus Bathyarchaeota archaeon BA1]